MSQNRAQPLVLDELTRFQECLPREWLRFASRVARQEKAQNPLPQEDRVPAEKIERFRQKVEERVMRLEALLQNAEAAFPTNPLPVEVYDKWRPVISLAKYGRTDRRRYTILARGSHSVGTPDGWKQNDQDLLIGILGASGYLALNDYVHRMQRAVENYGSLHHRFSQLPNESEESDYVVNWIPQFLRNGMRFTAARAAELFPLERTKQWPGLDAWEFQQCLEERRGSTKSKAWEYLLEWCASESRGEFHESINRELALLRAPEGTAMTADLPTFVAGFEVRLRFYATMMHHLAEIADDSSNVVSPNDWQPPHGYVGRKTICTHERFQKNGKPPSPTTIDYWVKRATKQGEEVKIEQDPASHENYCRETWVRKQIDIWNPRNRKPKLAFVTVTALTN